MNRITIRAWLMVCAATLGVSDSQACLTFCLQEGTNTVYGRNFDWEVDVGAVIVNQRHVRKTAFVVPPETPMSWVSKYGSVTFNQFSREVPVGGMNEKGLVIESLVSTAEHPRPDARSAVNELQWIQYHLDTCKTVDDVIRSAGAVRISKYAVSLHYFVSDHSGQTAVIAFIEGKMVHRSGNRLPVRVLANTRYDHALKTAPSKRTRFTRAAQMIDDYDGKKSATEYAFDVLDAVAQGDFTKWQVVYDIPRRRIHFRTLRNRKTKLITLSEFDFDHAQAPFMLDINIAGEGNMRPYFMKHTDPLNDELIKSCLEAFKKANIMQHIKPEHIEYIRHTVNSSKSQ